MHYRNLREAKNGDKIVQFQCEGGKVVSFGVLYDATLGNDYCNGSLAPVHGIVGACMCDCLHVDDLAKILADNGLDKRPGQNPMNQVATLKSYLDVAAAIIQSAEAGNFNSPEWIKTAKEFLGHYQTLQAKAAQ